jgi:hypothetical protein
MKLCTEGAKFEVLEKTIRDDTLRSSNEPVCSSTRPHSGAGVQRRIYLEFLQYMNDNICTPRHRPLIDAIRHTAHLMQWH